MTVTNWLKTSVLLTTVYFDWNFVLFELNKWYVNATPFVRWNWLYGSTLCRRYTSSNITSDRYNGRLIDRYNYRNDLPLAPTHLLSFVCLHSISISFCAWRACMSFHAYEMSRRGFPSCHRSITPFGSRAARYIDNPSIHMPNFYDACSISSSLCSESRGYQYLESVSERSFTGIL